MTSVFTKPAPLAPLTRARSVDINAIVNAVDSAFDQLPNVEEINGLKGAVSTLVDIVQTVDEALIEVDTQLDALPTASELVVLQGNISDLNTNKASLAQLAAPSGAGLAGTSAAGTGAVATTVRAKMLESVTVNDYMSSAERVDALSGSPVLDHAAAFARALAAAKTVHGDPACVYRIGSTVDVPSNKRLLGGGATIKGVAGVVAFHILGDRNRIYDWDIDANGALYFIRNDGQRNSIEWNTFVGDVGHYVFCFGAKYPRVCNNTVDGQGVYLITTSFVFEDCASINASHNTFTDIEHWCIQVRGATKHGTICGNVCSASEYNATIVATAGQTVFNFTISNSCHLAGVQVNGFPYDVGVTFAPAIPAATPTKNFTVTFAAGRTAGDSVKLIAHRAAENIQINGTSSDITISGNTCKGGGDSGILLAGSSKRCSVTGNIISNIAYAGISLEGGVTGCIVSGNIISDCSLVTTTATYSSGILLGGGDNSVFGNTIENTTTPPTMKYGVSVNTYNTDDGTADKSLKLGLNTYIGTFTKKIFIPNEDSAQRRQSIVIVGGLTTPYPERINLDGAWTNVPVNTDYWTYTGFGATLALRDTTIKQGGVASLKTVAGEYVEITPTARDIFFDTIVQITFRAKNDSGSSYVQTFITLAGSVIGSPGITITDPEWRHYTLSFPITANITPATFMMRVGANTGFANVDQFDVQMTRID